jgi:hypothetical protein
MRIEKLENGYKCYDFFPSESEYKDLAINFESLESMLIFFKNGNDKVLRYVQDQVGNEKIIRLYEVFIFPQFDEWIDIIDKIMGYTTTKAELVELLQYLKEKKEKENESKTISP